MTSVAAENSFDKIKTPMHNKKKKPLINRELKLDKEYLQKPYSQKNI